MKLGLEEHGLKQQSKYDSCLFYGKGITALVYVDDVVFFGPDQAKIDKLITDMQKDGFNINVEKEFFHFLGVDITKSKENKSYTLKQTVLINEILKTLKMLDCNVKDTPVLKTPLGADTCGQPFNEEWEYPSVVGMLFYLCSNSRPDIQYAVHQCARFNHFPRNSHAQAVRRVAGYLKATRYQGLTFRLDRDMKFDMYADADFAGLYDVEDHGDPVCVKSRTGYILFLGGCPITWSSKL